MDKQVIPTLPTRQPRKKIFAIRLTDEERSEIEAVARRLKLSDHSLAFHSGGRLNCVAGSNGQPDALQRMM